jgi:hypothetical protein
MPRARTPTLLLVTFSVAALGACATHPMDDESMALPMPGGKADGLDTIPEALPTALSATGLYADGALSPQVVPFEVEFPLWSDGAEKQRFLYVPSGSVIDTSPRDGFVYPIGTRAWKQFSLDGAPVETRFFVKVAEDRWLYGSYAWDATGGDATLAPRGVENARGDYDIPGREACWLCHRGAPDGLLGPSGVQLSHAEADPLAAFEAAGFIAAADDVRTEIPGEPATRNALGYLHANCSSCHVPRHPLTAAAAIDFTVPSGLATAEEAPVYTTVVDRASTHAVYGVRHLITSGHPEHSQVLLRMTLTDTLRMPPIGVSVVDEAGVALVRDWIASLPPHHH